MPIPDTTGPAFIQAGSAVSSGSTTSVSPSVPTLANSHGLLIAVVVVNASVTTSTATPGWSKLYETVSGGVSTQAIYLANGAAGAPTITWSGASAALARVAFFDDPLNPVETAIVGASTINNGSGTTLSNTGLSTTRDNSVVLCLASTSSNSTLTTPSGFTNLGITNQGTPTNGWFTQFVTNSGTPTGALTITAGTTGNWVFSLVELLLVVKPTGNYSIETEITTVTKIGDGSLTDSVALGVVTKVADGSMSASTDITAVTKIANGAMAETIELIAILKVGEEPVPGPVPPTGTVVRAWGFPLDGHDFYVLRVGDEITAVFDLTTGEQVEWLSADRNVWRPQQGTVWLYADRVVSGADTKIIVGDDSTGSVWLLDTTLAYDELQDFEGGNTAFERIVSTRVPLRMRNTIPCDAVYVTLNSGEPFTGEENISLYTSDDEGRNWTNHGAVTLAAGDYTQEVAWRSLGLMRAPGRLFEIRDNGACARISSIDIRFRGSDSG